MRRAALHSQLRRAQTEPLRLLPKKIDRGPGDVGTIAVVAAGSDFEQDHAITTADFPNPFRLQGPNPVCGGFSPDIRIRGIDGLAGIAAVPFSDTKTARATAAEGRIEGCSPLRHLIGAKGMRLVRLF